MVLIIEKSAKNELRDEFYIEQYGTALYGLNQMSSKLYTWKSAKNLRR